MKRKKMPTVMFLNILSLVVPCVGFLISVYMIISGFNANPVKSLISGFLVLLGSLVLAGIVRMMGIIGQMLMDFSGKIFSSFDLFSSDLKLQTEVVKDISGLLGRFESTQAKNTEVVKDIFGLLGSLESAQVENKKNILTLFDKLNFLQELVPINENIRDKVEQLNCDSKDINQNLSHLSDFIAQMEKHFDIKE